MEFLFGPKDKGEIKPEPLPAELQMPHEIKTYIMSRCFDACVGEFTHKKLMQNEKHCMEECTNHLKAVPYSYQQSHSYQGFSKKAFP